MKVRVLLRGLILIATFVALGYVFETRWSETLNEAWIDTQVRGQGLAGQMLFIGMGTLFTALGLPRQFVAFLGGYAFGLGLGTGLGLLAATLGCAAAFYYARFLGRGFVAARFGKRIQRLDAFLHDNPFAMVLLLRLLPVGSNLGTNLAGGLSAVRGTPFVLGSAVGYIPQTVVFALVGSGIGLDPELRIGLGVVLFVVTGALGVYLYRRYRHGKALDEELEQELGDTSETSTAVKE